MNDGGPAFPIAQEGISVRDYFAARAMAVLIQHDKLRNPFTDADMSYIAISAYAFADAMIKWREKEM